MTYWRAAGMNYIQFSSIAARIVRSVLKQEHQAEAMKRQESIIKMTRWKDGKQVTGKAE